MLLLYIMAWSCWIIHKSRALDWTRSTTSSALLSQMRSEFIGHYNSKIFIIGGWFTSTSLVEYDTIQETYTDHPNVIDFGNQYGQSSTQMGNILYMIPDGRSSITAFNLNTLSISKTISFSGTATKYSCVTHWNQYLFITGGADTAAISEFRVYDTTANSWSSGTALPKIRQRHTCNAVNAKLYILGGLVDGSASDDIITMSLSSSGNCCNGVWSTLSGTLYTSKSEHRSVVWGDDIYALGGLGGDDDVDIIHTDTGIVYRDSQMMYPKRMQAVVQMDESIFVVGGTPTANNQYFQHAVLTPTPAPTLNPIITAGPTHSPTDATMPPTLNPTVSSNVPTLIPTPPTQAPTLLPTFPSAAPTYSPTTNPSVSPTVSPTIAPTYSPSNAPSSAPTRWPTSVTEYNQQFNMIFLISMNSSNVSASIDINVDNANANIVPLIEILYVDFASKSGLDLQYRHFHIRVNEINTMERNETFIFTMDSSVNNYDDAIQNLFSVISEDTDFVENVENALSPYFHNETLQFHAEVVPETLVMDDTTAFDYVLYLLLAFMLVICLGSMAAFAFNKKSGTKIDDAQWAALMVFGLQIFDFVSDILLSTEILSKVGGVNANKEDPNGDVMLLYMAGFGSILFIILPYLINIAIAIQIESFVSGNNAASLYFKQRRILFISLMLFSGSAYSSMVLLSSRLFALDLFNSGITRYELQQLSSLKVFGSIIAENIPQLATQVIYVIYNNYNPSDSTVLSFVASFLSVIAALLSYLMQCKVSDCDVVQYELEMMKTNAASLSDEEKSIILRRKECKKELVRHVCAGLRTEFSALEFGFVNTTNTGFIVHVIHYVFKTDLSDTKRIKTPEAFIEELYKVHESEVNNAFTKHFEFEVEVKIQRVQNKSNVRHMDSSNTVIRMKSAIELQQGEETETVDDYMSDKGKNIIRLVREIEALLKQNRSMKHVEVKLIKSGHDSELVNHLLSIYSNDVIANPPKPQRQKKKASKSQKKKASKSPGKKPTKSKKKTSSKKHAAKRKTSSTKTITK